MILQHDNLSAIVMSDVPAQTLTTKHLNFTLDDEAANLLPSTRGQLPSGSYRPTDNDSVEDLAFPSPANTLPTDGSALSAFDGTDPNGTWNLYVVDDLNFGTGHIAGGWSLDITTGNSDPRPDPQPDITAPRVVSTTPALRATGVSPTSNITSTFSEDMDASTVNGATFQLFGKGSGVNLAASVGYDATTDRATLDPANFFGAHATIL